MSIAGVEEECVREVMDLGKGVGSEDDLDDIDAGWGLWVGELRDPLFGGVLQAAPLLPGKVVGRTEWRFVWEGRCDAACFDLDEDDEALVRCFHDEVDLATVVGSVVAEKEAVAVFSEVLFGESFAEVSDGACGLVAVG